MEFQQKKLKEQILHAYINIPYYKNLFDLNGIKPDDIRNPEDLKLIPFLTREKIIENFDLLIDRKNRYRQVIKSSSSGTTGSPISYIHDIYGESAGIAAGFAMYHLSGYTLGDRLLHIWGNSRSIKKWKSLGSKLKRKITNQINYPAFLMNDPNNYPELFNLINQIRPQYIDGYTNSIGSFARWLSENGLKIRGVKAVFTTAENLIPTVRESIEDTIGPVSDMYGCGEINGIAIQPISSSRYFILETHVIVETNNSNGTNEIVITDLNNRIMPLIRYKPGDTIDELIEPKLTDTLPFISFGSIDGRTSEYIKLENGKIIHPVNLLGGTFLRDFPAIRKHKVVWDGTKLLFVIETTQSIDLTKLNETIKSNLTDYDVPFEVEVSDKLLPGPSGKFRYIEILKS